MSLPIDLGLMKNPANWLIVFLMVAIAGLAVSLLLPSHIEKE